MKKTFEQEKKLKLIKDIAGGMGFRDAAEKHHVALNTAKAWYRDAANIVLQESQKAFEEENPKDDVVEAEEVEQETLPDLVDTSHHPNEISSPRFVNNVLATKNALIQRMNVLIKKEKQVRNLAYALEVLDRIAPAEDTPGEDRKLLKGVIQTLIDKNKQK